MNNTAENRKITGINYDQLTGMFEGFDWFQTKCVMAVPKKIDINHEHLATALLMEAMNVSKKVQDLPKEGEPIELRDSLTKDLGELLSIIAIYIDYLGLNMSDTAFTTLNHQFKDYIKSAQ